MNEDELKAGVHSWLAENQMQDVRNYVSRGRSFESASIDQLNSEWVALMRDWAADPRQSKNPRRTDIESEMTLRGLEPPYKLVKDELDTITRVAADAMEDMDEAEKEKLNTEIMDFIAEEKARGN